MSEYLKRVHKRLMARAMRADDDKWITINGTHVLVDKKTGEVEKGPKALKAESKATKKPGKTENNEPISSAKIKKMQKGIDKIKQDFYKEASRIEGYDYEDFNDAAENSEKALMYKVEEAINSGRPKELRVAKESVDRYVEEMKEDGYAFELWYGKQMQSLLKGVKANGGTENNEPVTSTRKKMVTSSGHPMIDDDPDVEKYVRMQKEKYGKKLSDEIILPTDSSWKKEYKDWEAQKAKQAKTENNEPVTDPAAWPKKRKKKSTAKQPTLSRKAEIFNHLLDDEYKARDRAERENEFF